LAGNFVGIAALSPYLMIFLGIACEPETLL